MSQATDCSVSCPDQCELSSFPHVLFPLQHFMFSYPEVFLCVGTGHKKANGPPQGFDIKHSAVAEDSMRQDWLTKAVSTVS